MGNYFRQIYTGSHAEWWTTVFDPHGQAGEGLVAFSFWFFFLELARVSLDWGGRGVGSRVGWEKGDGGQVDARREGRVINWWSASIVGVMGQMSAALMAVPDARLASPRLHPRPAPPLSSPARRRDEAVAQSGVGGKKN